MRLRADWLANALTVPYVPTLGPVHPDTATVELFEAVFTIPPGRFLPYDKDQRWFTHKDETVLTEHIHHGAEQTIIATLGRRGAGRVTIYHYARHEPDVLTVRETAQKLVAEYGVDTGRVVWFQHTTHPDAMCSRALLADTTTAGTAPDGRVLDLRNGTPANAASFAEFAPMAGDGMAYLGRLWAEGNVKDPILVAVAGRHVVGAIGPMQIYPVPAGKRQLLPQYFAVLPEHRRAGHGRALWRAAQQWGRANGASYQVLQAVPGSPADHLYHSESVHPLGVVCTVAA